MDAFSYGMRTVHEKMRSFHGFLIERAIDFVSLNPTFREPHHHISFKLSNSRCGHCKNLAPTYEQLGEAYGAKDEIIIAKGGCRSSNEVSEFSLSKP